jgi:adenylate kinase family enzyme
MVYSAQSLIFDLFQLYFIFMNNSSSAPDIAPQQTKLQLPKKVFFYGPNGGGKGTQAKLLTDFGYRHIEMSKLLESHANDVVDITDKKTQKVMKMTIGQAMAQGFFPPDDIINKILQDDLMRDPSEMALIDGGGRTVPQAEMAITSLKDANLYEDTRAVRLNISREQAVLQIYMRALLAKNPRPDDLKIDVINRRLEKYFKETLPATELFIPDNKLILVDGTTQVDLEKTVDILKEMRSKYEDVCLEPIFAQEHPDIVATQQSSIGIVHRKIMHDLQQSV